MKRLSTYTVLALGAALALAGCQPKGGGGNIVLTSPSGGVTAANSPDGIPGVLNSPAAQGSGNGAGGASGADYDFVEGWAQDDHKAALPALKQSCRFFAKKSASWFAAQDGKAGTKASWNRVCSMVDQVPASQAKAFFESQFVPFRVHVDGVRSGKITGYFSPVVKGSFHRKRGYEPLYKAPRNYTRYTRADVSRGVLRGHGLELIYVQNPVDAFMLQIQGSGFVELENGQRVHVRTSKTNEKPFKSMGTYGLSYNKLKALYRTNPGQVREILNRFPRYVYYTLTRDRDVTGAAGVPLTPERSIAVDQHYIPLGMPIWVQTIGPDKQPLKRLVLAQDIGGAIKGGIRADYFWGYGWSARTKAMATNAPGGFHLLIPREHPAQMGRAAVAEVKVPVQPANDPAASVAEEAEVDAQETEGQIEAVLAAAPAEVQDVPAPEVLPSAASSRALPIEAKPAYRIQLGAFGSAEAAQRAWSLYQQSASGALDHLQVYLEPVGSMVRLQAQPLESRLQADQLCNTLSSSKIPCHPIAVR